MHDVMINNPIPTNAPQHCFLKKREYGCVEVYVVLKTKRRPMLMSVSMHTTSNQSIVRIYEREN